MADIATLGIKIESTGASDATRSMNEMSGAAARAEAATQGLSTASQGASGAASAAARAYSTAGSAASSGSKQIEMMARAANQNSGALSASANSAKNFSYQARMVALQLSQVAQQTQAGTSFWQALAIQLPDLTLGFGAIGIAAGIAGGALLSYYGSMMSQSGQSAAALKEQQDLIIAIAERWQDAIPPLQEYAEKLKAAKEVSELRGAGTAVAAEHLDTIRKAVAEFNVQQSALNSTLLAASNATGSQRTELSELGSAYVSLKEKVESGLSTQEDFDRVRALATKAAATAGVSELSAFSDALDILSGKVDGPLSKLKELIPLLGATDGTVRMMDPRTWRGAATDYSLVNQVEGGSSEFGYLPYDGPTPTRRPTYELGYDGMPKDKEGSKRADPFANAIRSTQERTKVIQAEMVAQAGLNPLINDYEFSLTRAKAAADLLNAAEKAKKTLTPELNSEIQRTATALAEATAAQNRQAEAVQKAKQQMEFVKSTTAGFINDLRNGLREGQSFWEAFGNAALGVLDRITDKLLNDVLDAVFKVSGSASGSSGGGGILGSLFGGLFGGGTSAFPSKPGIGLYAAGTPAARPGLAWVGEKGPELVRFKGGEEVIPNHRIMSAANQNSGQAQVSASPMERREIVLRVVGEEGPMFRPTIRSESQGVVVEGIRDYHASRENLYQNGQAR